MGAAMRYALVNAAGETETVILLDGVISYEPPAGYSLVPEAGAPPMTSAPVTVPPVITARQARLALHAAGLLAGVDAAVTTAGGAVQIEWEYATEIERASPLVASIGSALGMDGAQIDALFIDAAGR